MSSRAPWTGLTSWSLVETFEIDGRHVAQLLEGASP